MTKDVSAKENEWFARNERQQLEDIRQQWEKTVAARMAEQEDKQREELKTRHWMQCPRSGQTHASERWSVWFSFRTYCQGARSVE